MFPEYIYSSLKGFSTFSVMLLKDGSDESNSEDKNKNQGGSNIPILNYENEIEIALITE